MLNDDVFVLLMIVVCLLMGCCFRYIKLGVAGVNVASPVGCVLSLFYLCAFQMYPVCVITSNGGLFMVL